MPWKDDLNEEYKESPAFKDIGDDINDLAKNYLDVQSHLGNAIRIPSSEASEEDVTQFHTRLQEKVPGLIRTPSAEDEGSIDAFLTALGKPDKADGYKLPEINGITIDPDRGKLFMDTAHEQGMTQNQFNGFLSKMYEADMTQQDIVSTARQEDALALAKEWGVTHEPRIKALTDNLLLSEAPADLTAAMKDNKLSGDTIKWLDGLFSKFAGETKNLDDNDRHAATGDLEPGEAAERASEIRKKMTDPDMVPTGPEYASLQAKLMKYERMAHPKSSTEINDLRAGVRSG